MLKNLIKALEKNGWTIKNRYWSAGGPQRNPY